MAFTTRTWAEIRERLQERYEDTPFWEAPEARLAFNEGLLTFNLLTGYWQTEATVPTVANQYLYTAPAALLYNTRLAFDGQPLSPSTREDLHNGRYRWRAETTTTGGDVPTRPLLWAPVSLTHFYIWPADAVGGSTLTINGVATTPVLVEDGDTVDLGDDLLNVLLGYALHVLTFKKGGPFFEATLPAYTAFLKAAAEENGQIKSAHFYRTWMGRDGRDQKPFRVPNVLDGVVNA